LEWNKSPLEDPSRYREIECARCGASVSPTVDVYEDGAYDVDSPFSGSLVRWTCERCGHTKMSPISADVAQEQLVRLEREAEEQWRDEHRIDDSEPS
jgi:RNase P subunit RPR2